jgi:L-asparaginase/N4-(beta-N-acetylglucosaminyl)-L-asparaginase
MALLPGQSHAGPSPEKEKVMKQAPIAQNAPTVISTWNHGIPANAAAWTILETGGSSLDAAEAGVRVPEADPLNTSVGYGGLPDREGHVTLDACIMDYDGRCGGVCFLQGFMHPISVARKVMEQTPHVLLAGKGAEDFADAMGFERSKLLTPESREAWKAWRKSSEYKPIINRENHDTIGLLALDAQGRLAGACTTSGLAYKLHGRVGDSPIIGAGLYVDGDVGAATATGLGEMVIKICGSFLVVELMRQGATPQQACEEAVRRIAARQDTKDSQVGFLALDRHGRTGAYAIHPGFNYALTRPGQHELVDATALLP